MKKILYLIMAVVISALVSGCASPGIEVKVPNAEHKIEIFKKHNVYSFFKYDKSLSLRGREGDSLIMKKQFKQVFNIVATLGLSKNYKYMALVNENFNNLSGYPINTWDSMKKFINLYGYKHYQGSFVKSLTSGNNIFLKVVYLKERIPGLFLWNLKKLSRDTQ